MKWEKESKGWYTSGIGGVVKEDNGWYFYPREGPFVARIGPFKTLKEAKEKAERSDT